MSSTRYCIAGYPLCVFMWCGLPSTLILPGLGPIGLPQYHGLTKAEPPYEVVLEQDLAAPGSSKTEPVNIYQGLANQYY